MLQRTTSLNSVHAFNMHASIFPRDTPKHPRHIPRLTAWLIRSDLAYQYALVIDLQIPRHTGPLRRLEVKGL